MYAIVCLQTDPVEPVDSEEAPGSRSTSISGAVEGGDEGGGQDEAIGEALPKDVIPPHLDNVLVQEALPVGPSRYGEIQSMLHRFSGSLSHVL